MNLQENSLFLAIYGGFVYYLSSDYFAKSIP